VRVFRPICSSSVALRFAPLLRLKLLHACGQCFSSRLVGWTIYLSYSLVDTVQIASKHEKPWISFGGVDNPL
jgi:hypothetical protein